jgi:hypothetical protein
MFHDAARISSTKKHRDPMDPRHAIVTALNHELLRGADDRRRSTRQASCRERVLGLPIGRRCDAVPAC